MNPRKPSQGPQRPLKSRARRAGGYAKCLAIGLLMAVLLVSCSTGPRLEASPNLNKLTWAPPACGDVDHACVELRLENTGWHQVPRLDADTDYRIRLPTDGPLVGGLTITGGRRVLIIGGQIDLTYPCSNDASECIGLYIAKSTPGAVFVEGLWIHNPVRIENPCPGGASETSQTCSTGDGIAVNTANHDVTNFNRITLQNIRVDGISGCSGHGDHSDVLQPYQAPGNIIRIDRMTGRTNCQGFMLDPDLAYSRWQTFPTSIRVKNVNVGVFRNPYHGAAYEPITWWLTHGHGCRSGRIVLRNVYAVDADGRGLPDRIWPYNDCGAWYLGHVLSWANENIEGSIRIGRPPLGAFVPRGAAGLDYRSPGYR